MLSILTGLGGLTYHTQKKMKKDNIRNSRMKFYEQGEAGNEAMVLTKKLHCSVFVGLRNPLVNIKLWDGDRNLHCVVMEEI